MQPTRWGQQVTRKRPGRAAQGCAEKESRAEERAWRGALASRGPREEGRRPATRLSGSEPAHGGEGVVRLPCNQPPLLPTPLHNTDTNTYLGRSCGG